MRAVQATRSAGAVLLRRVPGGRRYLLLRAYRNWDFPKGLVEPGEDPLAAARREVREETGIRDLAFPWGEAFVETPPYAGGKVARYYLAETATEAVDLGADPSGRREHHEARWLAHAEARGLLVARLRAVIDWAEALAGATPPA
jgi:bis(5'-nucleosidyl)-tetraphosphatase